MIRRRFLLGMAGASLLAGARRALAIGDATRLHLAHLDLGAAPDRPLRALERLVWELTLRTSVTASYDVLTMRVKDPGLFASPFLYLWGDRDFPPLEPEALERLRRHLEFGGTLLADDGSGRSDSPFAGAVQREAARLFPGKPLQRLPDEHSVFRSYYLLRRLGGRSLVSPFLEGVTVADRAPLLLCRNDLGGAWAQDHLGRFLNECVPGGESQRQQAFMLGVNIVLYALTVNYKQDQVHLPFILERMRR